MFNYKIILAVVAAVLLQGVVASPYVQTPTGENSDSETAIPIFPGIVIASQRQQAQGKLKTPILPRQIINVVGNGNDNGNDNGDPDDDSDWSDFYDRSFQTA